jgi:hypothetical protein
MAARRAGLHHLDLTTHPGAGVLDRFTWSWVLRLNRLEQVKDVLRARRGPKSEEMMIRISEGPAATKRDEARVPNLREDHGWALLLRGRAASSTVASFEHRSGPSCVVRPDPGIPLHIPYSE